VPGEWEVPILRTEAATGAGVAELLAEIDRHSAWIAEQGELERRRSRNLRNEVMGIAASRLRRRLDAAADRSEVEELLREVAGRETDPATAAERLLEMTGGTDGE
jgi:LAO/AO transport system kinase